mmetsp:Transcript_19447/g.36327  ORF Transcript_19447/g.36327 Transcript_19447/m.36327 type:complete len:81 (-) Transcript_19447:1555-1797(-)
MALLVQSHQPNDLVTVAAMAKPVNLAKTEEGTTSTRPDAIATILTPPHHYHQMPSSSSCLSSTHGISSTHPSPAKRYETW